MYYFLYDLLDLVWYAVCIVGRLLLAGLLIALIVLILRGKDSPRSERRNGRQVCAADAVVISKRSTLAEAGNEMLNLVTFRTETEELEMPVAGPDFYLLAEGDRGVLNYTDERFVSFTKDR